MQQHFPVDQIKPNSQPMLIIITRFLFNPKPIQIYEN